MVVVNISTIAVVQVQSAVVGLERLVDGRAVGGFDVGLGLVDDWFGLVANGVGGRRAGLLPVKGRRREQRA